MVSRIFIRFLGPCSVSKGFGSFLFVRSVDCDAPSGLSVPGVPRVPANGCGFSILKEAEKFLGRVTYGADSGWLLSLVDVSADDALPPFHSGGDSTRGYRRGQIVHGAGNGVVYGDRMRLPGGWGTALPDTSGSTYPASGMTRGGGRPSSILSALRIASSRERAGVIPILSTSSGRREETRITLHDFALESVACAVCP